MKTGRQLAVLAAIAVVAGGGWFAFDRFSGLAMTGKPGAERAGSQRARLIETAVAALRPIETSVDAVGTSLALQSVEIVPLASGRIAEIAFTAGQRVAAGDILVRLDSDIEQADVRQAEAVLKEVDIALDRARTLHGLKAGKQSTVDELAAKRATAQASLDRAQRKLADRTVRAPFSGIVGLRRVDIGARVDATTALTTLDDLSEIKIDFKVPERHYGQIAQGQVVTATTVAFPGRSFVGKVSAIDSRIDQVGRAFRVRALVPNPDGALPAGLFMLVKLVLERAERLTVPEEAVMPEAGRTYVFVVAKGKVSRREVKLGQRDIGVVEVREGLSAGDTVVIKGFAALRDGASVRVVNSGKAGGS